MKTSSAMDHIPATAIPSDYPTFIKQAPLTNSSNSSTNTIVATSCPGPTSEWADSPMPSPKASSTTPRIEPEWGTPPFRYKAPAKVTFKKSEDKPFISSSSYILRVPTPKHKHRKSSSLTQFKGMQIHDFSPMQQQRLEPLTPERMNVLKLREDELLQTWKSDSQQKVRDWLFDKAPETFIEKVEPAKAEEIPEVIMAEPSEKSNEPAVSMKCDSVKDDLDDDEAMSFLDDLSSDAYDNIFGDSDDGFDFNLDGPPLLKSETLPIVNASFLETLGIWILCLLNYIQASLNIQGTASTLHQPPANQEHNISAPQQLHSPEASEPGQPTQHQQVVQPQFSSADFQDPEDTEWESLQKVLELSLQESRVHPGILPQKLSQPALTAVPDYSMDAYEYDEDEALLQAIQQSRLEFEEALLKKEKAFLGQDCGGCSSSSCMMDTCDVESCSGPSTLVRASREEAGVEEVHDPSWKGKGIMVPQE
ncbi:hypothetical protein HDU80_004551 [Chytriomyces hyalinus]|nr:hypothetical protein HDU80_004551 [Chytriomyces hyalinus]